MTPPLPPLPPPDQRAIAIRCAPLCLLCSPSAPAGWHTPATTQPPRAGTINAMYIIPLSDELFCSLESGTQILRYPIGPVAFPPLSAPLLRLTPGACRLPVPYISRAIADALCAGVRACPLGLLAARTVTAPTRSFPPVGSFPLCGSPHQPRGSWGLVVDPAPLSRAGGLPTLHPRPAPFSFHPMGILAPYVVLAAPNRQVTASTPGPVWSPSRSLTV